MGLKVGGSFALPVSQALCLLRQISQEAQEEWSMGSR